MNGEKALVILSGGQDSTTASRRPCRHAAPGGLCITFHTDSGTRAC
jgi:7-cyano-7-deazaguanine synthase in queuosine biosynthesis